MTSRASFKHVGRCPPKFEGGLAGHGLDVRNAPDTVSPEEPAHLVPPSPYDSIRHVEQLPSRGGPPSRLGSPAPYVLHPSFVRRNAPGPHAPPGTRRPPPLRPFPTPARQPVVPERTPQRICATAR